jgi:lipid-binding SYLF domain-containing protein
MKKKLSTKQPREKSMKTKMQFITSAVLVALVFGSVAQAVEELAPEAKQTVADFKNADPSLATFFDESAGYAVFPHVGKGGFIVGAARGKGLVYEKSGITGQATMTQASVGAQAGGQSFAEVIFFENPTALQDFKAGKFEMSADISAVAAAEGASRAVKYKKGVAVFTLSKRGLMLQASVGGQKFKFEPRAIQPTGRSTSTPEN